MLQLCSMAQAHCIELKSPKLDSAPRVRLAENRPAPQNGGWDATLADNSQSKGPENAQVEKLLSAVEQLTSNIKEAHETARPNSGARRRKTKPHSAPEPPPVQLSQTAADDPI